MLALIPLIAVALSVTSSLLSPQQEAALSGFVEQLAASVAPPVNLATNAPPVNGVSTNGWGAIPPDALADANGLAAEMLTNPPPVAVATVNPQNQVAQDARGLWLGIRLERIYGDTDALASYELALKHLYPDSPEYKAYLQSQQ